MVYGDAGRHRQRCPGAHRAGSIPLNGDFSVTVAGKNSPVYTAKAAITYNYQWPGPAATTEPVGFTNFDITGAVTATITVRNRTVNSAKVVPANYNVTPTVNGNVITVPITHPGKYEVQINGSEHKVLYLFANPVDPNPPKPGDPVSATTGRASTTSAGSTVGSNQTVYIAAGAIVHGELTTNGSATSRSAGAASSIAAASPPTTATRFSSTRRTP